MGRFDFAPQNVYKHATQLLHAKRIPAPPSWYNVIERIPPSARLVRQPMQRNQQPGAKQPRQRKKSKLFQPLNLTYEEDALRWEYYNDHPWELARPRVILENDGRDMEKWDWSLPLDYALRRPAPGQQDVYDRALDVVWDQKMAVQSARPINGESVVQRQQYLMQHEDLAPSKAYDQARKELYRYRHAQEVEVRVAREEALAVGSYFGRGPLEIADKLEDAAYEDWRKWAAKEIIAAKQLTGSAYTGLENESASAEIEEPEQQELQEVSSIPSTKSGQTALGGAAVHP